MRNAVKNRRPRPAQSWQTGLGGLLVTALLVACAQFAPSAPPTSQSAPATLLIAAAASLQTVLQDIMPLYVQAHPGQTITYHFAASGALQQQIEQGAPGDVLIAAAAKQMDALQAKNLLAAGTRQDLLTNQLVLITPKAAAVALTEFQQLVKPEVQRIAIGEPRTVPAGQYATEVLQNLGILPQVAAKFLLQNTVKAVLAAVETGNVDAGIVYITDAQRSAQVTVVATAEAKLHKPIRYPIAVLQSSQFPNAARQYVEFLQSAPAQALFKQYGFGLASPSGATPP